MTKNGALDSAAAIMERALESCGAGGDSYYILAQIHKLRNAKDEYIKCMNNALKYNTTLSVSPKLVKRELDSFIN